MNEEDYVKALTENLLRQKDNFILEQLNEFISRGLLVVNETQPVLVRDINSQTLILRQCVELVLKDQQYIERLELENHDLKEKLALIKASLEKL